MAAAILALIQVQRQREQAEMERRQREADDARALEGQRMVNPNYSGPSTTMPPSQFSTSTRP